MSSRSISQLLMLTTLLAVVVVVLGAHVRIRDAGLGCPDWPGCYGQIIGIPDDPEELARAQALYPHQPVSADKARWETIHRYAAAGLGLLIFLLAVVCWRLRRTIHTSLGLSGKLVGGLVALVIFQALLGMWTVTLLLKPLVVTAHLLGGMTILGLLTFLWARSSHPHTLRPQRTHVVMLITVVMQIAFGGWVSSHYAGVACPDYPLCHIAGDNTLDFANAFSPTIGFEAGPAALRAIHFTHRWFAVVVLLTGLFTFAALWRQRRRALALVLLALLFAQITLGIANVVLRLPVALATLHNLLAALLLMLSIYLLAAPDEQHI